jgi:glycerophosphoryl diester phosphodiesterase
MPPLLLGHRGARATRTIPENTLESFDLALAHGCDGFEFDVRLTADEHAVICHDAMADGCEVAQAAASDLPQLPRLESVLDRYAHRAFLDIELKVTGLETATLNALYFDPPRRGYVVSSFLPEVLSALRELDAEIPLGLICETQSQLVAWRSLPVQYVMPHHTLVDSALCKSLHSEAKKVFVWTVNRTELMTHFREINADAIISDDTELLIETLRGGAKS